MDKFLYIAASGAKQNLHGISVKAHNLANAKTTGFKADLEQARAMQAFGEGLPTRVFAMQERPGVSLTSGGLITTDNDLDIALSDNAYLTVYDTEDNEAYTRAGKLKVDENGQLLTANNLPVIGTNGPIVLPVPIEKVTISQAGTVQIRPEGAPANFLEEVDQLRIVRADGIQPMYKGEDGLLRPKAGVDLEQDFNIKVTTGALEQSNVNPVSEMVGMIEHQRQFELQIKMMKTAEQLDESQSSLMRIF
jgi:flagellar basal-body rod protein FlgF